MATQDLMGAKLATQQFHPPLRIVQVFRGVLDGEEGGYFPLEGGTLLEAVENLTTGGILHREPVLQGFGFTPRRRGERDGESMEGDDVQFPVGNQDKLFNLG